MKEEISIFTLNEGEVQIELFKLLKANNMCGSGGEAKVLIAEGMVKVNDEITTVKRLKIKPEDVVEFNGEQVKVMIN